MECSESKTGGKTGRITIYLLSQPKMTRAGQPADSIWHRLFVDAYYNTVTRKTWHLQLNGTIYYITVSDISLKLHKKQQL